MLSWLTGPTLVPLSGEKNGRSNDGEGWINRDCAITLSLRTSDVGVVENQYLLP